MLENVLLNLEDKIKDLFGNENSGHDITHLKRVTNMALKIQQTEGGNRDVIGISAFVHDLHRVIAIEKGKKYCSPEESLEYIEKLLIDSKIDILTIKKVLHCVKYHEETNFMGKERNAKDIETLILQDADNLDAMGAIGIARSFTYGGAHNIKIWDGKPLGKIEEFRDISTDSPTTIEHFYDYLLKLKNTMNTDTAKALAEQKHKFMEAYLQAFLGEWNIGKNELLKETPYFEDR